MPYDYNSVMHYQKTAFSVNGSATIEPLQPNVKIGQRYILSPVDIATVQKFYSCSDVGTILPTTTASKHCQPNDYISDIASTKNSHQGSQFHFHLLNPHFLLGISRKFSMKDKLILYPYCDVRNGIY